jgi:murein DD-endopeptidase MepM/ murein hydrolase activator NlpD
MRRSSAIATSLVFVLLLSLALVPTASAATQEELEAAQRRAAAAREAAAAAEAEAAELQVEVDRLDAVVAEAQAELDRVRGQMAEVTARREKLDAEIEALEAEIALKQSEIEATQAELDERYDALAERVRTTYKQGGYFELELILNARSLGDLIERTTLVQYIMEEDERIAAELTSTRERYEDAKDQLGRDAEAVETKRQEVIAEEARLSDLRNAEAAELAAEQGAQAEKQGLLDETEANADRLRELAEAEEAESRRIAAELSSSASSGAGQFNGEMAWPVPGFYRITSPYGYRTHPIFGTQKLHTGIDVGKNPDGTPIDGATIVAAGDGEVLFAGSKGGYGNTVMIDHGDGVVTLYAHQRSGSIAVGVGQWVTKGQSIGQVGSTGYSTGPHLHFEVRVNGEPVDPMGYLR